MTVADVKNSETPKVPVKLPKLRTVHGYRKSSLPALGVAALGIVFGDIGTSPLYTLKTVLDLSGSKGEPAMVLGVLSAWIVWTLIVITTIKYVNFAMRVDNDGEGGILALMSLIGIKRNNVPAIVAVGLFGAPPSSMETAPSLPRFRSCPPWRG